MSCAQGTAGYSASEVPKAKTKAVELAILRACTARNQHAHNQGVLLLRLHRDAL